MRSSDSGGSAGGVSGDGSRVGNMQGCEDQRGVMGGEGPSHVGGKLHNIVVVFIHSPQSVGPLWAFRLPQHVDGERGEGVERPLPTERRDRAEDKSRLSEWAWSRQRLKWQHSRGRGALWLLFLVLPGETRGLALSLEKEDDGISARAGLLMRESEVAGVANHQGLPLERC